MTNSKVLNLTGSNEFEKEVIKSDKPVLVDFWAPWCMPCQMMAPILDQLSEELGEKLIIAKIDTENPDNQELAIQYQIQSIPNMKLFKNGKVVQEFIGLRPADTFKKELEKYL